MVPPVPDGRRRSTVDQFVSVHLRVGYRVVSDRRGGWGDEVRLSRISDEFVIVLSWAPLPAVAGVEVEVHSPCVWPDGRQPR